MTRASIVGRDLCLIADRATFAAEALISKLRAVLALAGPEGSPSGLRPGPRTFVIDRGEAPTNERLARLRELLALCRGAGALLMVSGRVDLALALGADGVHLPERGVPAELVRATWPRLLVGRSCHDRAGLIEAQAAGADYALLSPVAWPTSKPRFATSPQPLGTEGFSTAIRDLELPVLALGGVTPALASALRQAGSAGLATLGDVLGAPDPAARARALLTAWDAGAS